ncbi:hypothetical protein [Gilvibacter sp.]|uniref:hypothetical protein n=1 Tax=Gilvibacter sp. TaxID=2729997 RepID=UPI003B51FC99
MKILIVDSFYTKESFAEEVFSFLSETDGIWEFELGEREDIEEPPPDTGVHSWSSIFERLANYRQANKIPEETFILFLTREANWQNWFGMFDIDGRPQGFVQTSFWNELVSSESLYPILYEVIAIPLHWRMFKDAEGLEGNVHMNPIGCINDFCQDKKDIILKLQTGNICSTCYQKMMDVGMTEQEFDHIDELLDRIRQQFRIFNINRNKRRPAPLSLRNSQFYIGENKLKLSPIQRALYLFFLQTDHRPRTDELRDYEKEIRESYGRFYSGGDLAEMNDIAGRIARNEDNLATQSVSRINSAISRLVISELAEHYKIVTDNEGRKSITAILENQ